MASNNDFNSRLSKLKEFSKSQDYLNIINTLNPSFDSDADDIIKKWISNDILSNDETKYLNLYSNVQLSFVKYCFFNSNTITNVQTIIDKFRMRLFQKTQTDTLASAVEFIREQESNDENDSILIYIMRMIDARSLAYRLYFKNLNPPPKDLNDELKECLLHRHAKKYLNDIRSMDETNENISIDNRHRFFIGCCTFAVALYEKNKEMLKDDERNNKYICLLVKYVRIMLRKSNFEKNESILYCIRGILALLTNCVPFEHWLHIMNEGLANENDENAQKKNPFNLDLFSLIVNKLLASSTLQKKTEESGSNDETLLLDTVLVFLVKWSDTQKDLNDDDDEQMDTNNNNNSSPFDEQNQLLRCFCSLKQFDRTIEIIIPYIDAKYDRLRLMALSILSNIMNNEDFKALKNQKPHMAKDLIKLLFDFINQAAKQPDHKYKGISFDMLLCYLLRFLVQDFVKKETLPYVSQIVNYAKNSHLYDPVYLLKVLRKISTNPDLNNDLLKNDDLKRFLETDANDIYSANQKMYKIIKNIRQNLAPPPKTTDLLPTNDGNNCQVFISYSHRDNVACQSIQQKLKEVKLFTNIWLDKNYMRDDMFGTVAQAIRQSKVVYVLLSDEYCKSDFCRREWTYAVKKQIKTYIIVVQKDFDENKYDWVDFLMGNELHYKMHKSDAIPSLLEHSSEFLNKKIDNTPKIDDGARPSSPPRPKVPADVREYSSIATWTPEDIQAWCMDKNLGKWCKPLENFDGQNLLVLRQELSNDSYIQYITKGNDLDGFDVARFKNEIDKLLSIQKTTHKPPTAKHVIKRRISKSSNK